MLMFSTNVHLKDLTAFLPNRCYLLGGLSVGNLKTTK
jgi:hypothetical protein